MTELSQGRTNQKRRTRQALLAAANDLLAQGVTPTIDQVAEAALVSRATAYRYFSSVDALVADAFFERGVGDPASVVQQAGDDLGNRLLAVEALLNELLLSDEIALHVMARNLMEQWLTAGAEAEGPRPARRLPYIDAALDGADSALSPSSARRLRHAAALAIGMEAVLTLRDVCGLDAEEARETARWAIAAMVERAIADA